MSKKDNAFSNLPGKIKAPTHAKDRKTRREWENYIQDLNKRYCKVERKNSANGLLDRTDLTGAMEKRRVDVVLNLMDEIYRRYSPYGKSRYNMLGEQWIQLNYNFNTYNILENRYQILTAATLWVLDRISESEEGWETLNRLIPKEESFKSDVILPDLWDPCYDYELIEGVQYILQTRNFPEMKEDAEKERYITDTKTALDKHKVEAKNRKVFDQLIALIPTEDIERAVEHFEKLFWDCADRFFSATEPLVNAIYNAEENVEKQRQKYNAAYDEIEKAVKNWDAERKRQKSAKPEAVLGRFPDIHQFSNVMMSRVGTQYLAPEAHITRPKSSKDVLIEKATVMERLSQEYDDSFDEVEASYELFHNFVNRMIRQGFIHNCSEYGEEVESRMHRLDIGDPFELCFALLYLVDQGSNLPWAYGVGVTLMEEVAECLPWGILDYNENEDDIWLGEENIDKPVTVPQNASIPDINSRQYQEKGSGASICPRSLAQLIYEETGCLLPRNMHRYDSLIKELKSFGVTGKNAAFALASMSILGQARRQRTVWKNAEELDTWQDTEDNETEKDEDQIVKLKNEIKRLRSALHESDRASRDLKRDYEDLKDRANRDKRELANLREYVFNLEEEAEDEIEEEESIELPYEVRKNTVIFGGHPSWVRAIKPMLKGNVRFVDKDMLAFDVSVVRNADIVWIQPNAISHPMFYKISDAAKTNKTEMRYFTNASAEKCAQQVAEND